SARRRRRGFSRVRSFEDLDVRAHFGRRALTSGPFFTSVLADMDSAAFARQLPECLPSLRALAGRMLGNRDDAEDVVQEALLHANRTLGSFRQDSSLKTWLFSITARLALDHLRARKRWSTQVMVDACDARGRGSVEAKYADPSIHFDVGQHVSF